MMLCRLLEAYGADSAHWPEEERAAAEALLRGSAAARAALAEARELDAFLQRHSVAAADPDLAERVIARALDAPQERGMTLSPRSHDVGEGVRVRGPLFPFRLWPRLAGLAVAGVLGFVVGIADFDIVGLDRSVDLSDFADFSSDLEDPLS
jgi:hypothetical protein